ncbi:hypothetical protein LX83_000159 [Goodfellowiella coeruleoviolacea]|uniref:Uncharacterized protein n=1 Tax=Goodfellowiella coeruleoviolacea TaxID=334858 RepID=A0AAE3GAC1_9PSEU|nr:hypothetical protein [Goodfellowiella coeruleoviolacea]
MEHLAIKGGMLYLNGCVFSRVRISGRIGPLMAVSPMPKPREKPSPVAEQSIIRAYESIDWALDVSGAEFTDVSLDYVPGDLVRRDPETQFLLHRQRLADLDHRALPIDADIYLSRFEHSPFDSMVAVAPKRSRHFRDLLRILERLRELGLAE